MWHRISFQIKSRRLRALYPEILSAVILPNPDFTSPADSSFIPSSLESVSTGLSINSSQKISSESTDTSQEETTGGTLN